MRPADFYARYWTHMLNVERRMVPPPGQWDKGYGGVSLPGGIKVWGNLKERYDTRTAADGTRSFGRDASAGTRYAVVSLYTAANSDHRWLDLVARVRADPPVIARTVTIFDENIGNAAPSTTSQIIFELGPVSLEEAEIPALAAWMAPAWRALLAYVTAGE